MSRSNDHAKGALLFSGLFASGPTLIHEPVLSRDHTERMFDALGLPVQAAGSMVSLHPPADPLAIRGFDADIPGDISAAAFVLAAAQLVPGQQRQHPPHRPEPDARRYLGHDSPVRRAHRYHSHG